MPKTTKSKTINRNNNQLNKQQKSKNNINKNIQVKVQDLQQVVKLADAYQTLCNKNKNYAQNFPMAPTTIFINNINPYNYKEQVLQQNKFIKYSEQVTLTQTQNTKLFKINQIVQQISIAANIIAIQIKQPITITIIFDNYQTIKILNPTTTVVVSNRKLTSNIQIITSQTQPSLTIINFNIRLKQQIENTITSESEITLPDEMNGTSQNSDSNNENNTEEEEYDEQCELQQQSEDEYEDNKDLITRLQMNRTDYQTTQNKSNINKHNTQGEISNEFKVAKQIETNLKLIKQNKNDKFNNSIKLNKNNNTQTETKVTITVKEQQLKPNQKYNILIPKENNKDNNKTKNYNLFIGASIDQTMIDTKLYLTITDQQVTDLLNEQKAVYDYTINIPESLSITQHTAQLSNVNINKLG